MADQNMSFHGHVGRVIGQITMYSYLTSKQSVCQSQSSGHSDDVCYVWGLPHVYG